MKSKDIVVTVEVDKGGTVMEVSPDVIDEVFDFDTLGSGFFSLGLGYLCDESYNHGMTTKEIKTAMKTHTEELIDRYFYRRITRGKSEGQTFIQDK
jgi:hypothetical protein